MLTEKAVYQAEAWHDFHVSQDWVGTGERIVIIPGDEDKEKVLKAFDYVGGRIYTIPELISLYVKDRTGRGLISPAAVETILNHIITDSRVSYLKMEKFRQSYGRALADFFCAFRSTSLKDMGQALEELRGDGLSFKEKDLVQIYREYERKLPDFGRDLRGGLMEFLENVNVEQSLGLKNKERVIFLGFNYFTPVEEAFICHVFKHVPKASLLYCRAETASGQAMRIGETAVKLVESLKALGADYYRLPAREGPFPALSRDLFGPGQGKGCGAGVFISSANSRYQEVVSIARRIRELQDGGTTLSDVRLVAPAFQLYSLIIGEVFPEYGIPFTLEKGSPLLRYPLAQVILQLVSQGSNANPYSLREKIFSSPYISFSDEVSPDKLTAYQESCGVELLPGRELTARVKPGRYSLDFTYLKTLRQEAYFSVKPLPGVSSLEVVKRYLGGMYDNKDELAAQLARYLLQSYLAAQAEGILSRWPSRLGNQVFAGTLRGLINRFQVRENLENCEDTRNRDEAVFNRVQGLMAEIELDAPAQGKKHSFSELTRFFTRLMEEASLKKEEYNGAEEAGVVVQPVDGGQYHLWKHTFICGMVDGEFPPVEEFNFLKPKKEGLALGQAYTRVDHGRNDFYHLVRSTTGTLYLSRPLSDNGKRLAPSPFLGETEKCLPEKTASLASGPGDREKGLYSLREKLSFIAKKVDLDFMQAKPVLEELQEDKNYSENVLRILRFDGLTMNAGFSEYDGIFTKTSPAREMLAGEIKEKGFTPGVLERYAACPLRYFFDDILNLRTKPDYDPDTTEAGLLVRSLMKEYTARACRVNGVPEDAESFFMEALDGHLEEGEAQGLDAFQTRFLTSLAAGLGEETPRRRGLLCSFLRHEREGPDFLTPFLGDLSGVLKLGDGLEVRVEVDRVDRAGDTDYIVAFLYTLTGDGNASRIARGLRFDLPLAALLCMQYIDQQNLQVSVGGAGLYQVRTPRTLRRSGYFALDKIKASRREGTCPRVPVFSGSRTGFFKEDEFIQALQRVKDHILRLYGLMHRGVFHLPLCAQAEQTCRNCSFGRLCRKEQLRLEKTKTMLMKKTPGEEDFHIVRDIL